MTDASASQLMWLAREAVLAGATVAMGWRDRSSCLVIEEKNGPSDLVSRADRESEEAIIAVLSGARPHDGILAEEHGTTPGSSGVEWAIDPIDGTTNYLYGRADWAVSVAALTGPGRRVLAAAVSEPMLDQLTVACDGGGTWAGDKRIRMAGPRSLASTLVEVNFGRQEQRPAAGSMVDALLPHTRDVRRGGSAASALAQVATGRADALWAPGLQPWDGAAGALLVHEAGGMIGDLAGPTPGAWPTSGDILAAAPAVWTSLHQLLVPVYANGVCPGVTPGR